MMVKTSLDHARLSKKTMEILEQYVKQTLDILREGVGAAPHLAEQSLGDAPLVHFLPGELWDADQRVRGSSLKHLLLRAAQSISPPEIFLSYAHLDAERVKEVRDLLNGRGFKVWRDRERVRGGQRTWQTIEKAIDDSNFFIACLSTKYDRRGMIQRELKRAVIKQDNLFSRDVYIIPVRLEPCETPDELVDYQRIDLYESDGSQQLLDALQAALDRRRESIFFAPGSIAAADFVSEIVRESPEIQKLAAAYVIFSENGERTFSDYQQHESQISTLASRSAVQGKWDIVLLLTRGFCEYLEQARKLEDFKNFAELGREAAIEANDRRREILHGAHLGWHYYWAGELQQANSTLRGALDRAEGHQHPHEEALAARTLGLVLLEMDLFEEAERYGQRALLIWKKRGDLRWIARATGLIGLIALERGDWGKAESFLIRARSMNRGISPEGSVMNLVDLAEMWRRRGDLKEAQKSLKEALASAERDTSHDRYAYALMHRALLTVSLAEADLKSALRHLDRAQEVYSKDGRSIMRERIDSTARGIGAIIARIGDRFRFGAAPVTARRADFVPSLTVFFEEYRRSEPLRRESPDHYVAHLPPVFESVASDAEVPPPPPLCVQLEITNACSTRCKMCLRWSWENQQSGSATAQSPVSRRPLETGRIVELLTELARMYPDQGAGGRLGVESVVLSGGEPVIHPDFATILSHARREGLHVGILSNGIWNPELARVIVENADWIRLSVDGSTPEVYDRIRQPMPGFEGGLAAIERSLEGLARAKRDLGRTDFRLAIAYTIQKHNIDDVRNMVRFAERSEHLREEPGPVVIFKLAHGKGNFLCDEGQLAEFAETILKDDELLNIDRTNLKYMKTFFDLMAREDMARGEPLRTYYGNDKFTCFTPYLFSLVDAFGDVFVCCHLYDDNGRLDAAAREDYRIGNITEKKFADIWASEKYGKARKDLLRIDVNSMRPCAQCTRHFRPNTVLTGIYDTVYQTHLNLYGEKEGKQSFRTIAAAHRPEVVWF